MKVAIATVQVPFTRGGAEIHAELLKTELKKRGYNADIVTIPFKWYPYSSLMKSIEMGRMMDLSSVNGEKIDKVIAMKFPAYLLKHDDKVLWLLHQHRQAYDLWNTSYGDIHLWDNGVEVRDFIRKIDKKYIPEARKIYTNAKCTADRLKNYCDINGTALYHPPLNYDKFYTEEYKDYFFYPSRINSIKRQRVLVEAMKYVKTDVKAVISGGAEEDELVYINNLIKENKLENKVKLTGFISEEEKLKYYANAIGIYFGAYNEDYGYITLESFYAKKPVIVHTDAGGPLEFVTDNYNGYVIEADAKEVAKKLDYLYENKDEAKKLGENGYKSLQEKNINWDYVINSLLS